MAKQLQFSRQASKTAYNAQKGVFFEVVYTPALEATVRGRVLAAFMEQIYQRDLCFTGRILENPAEFFVYPFGRLAAVNWQDREALLDWLAKQPHVATARAGTIGETMGEYRKYIAAKWRREK